MFLVFLIVFSASVCAWNVPFTNIEIGRQEPVVQEDACAGIEPGGVITVSSRKKTFSDIWGENYECLTRFPKMTLVTLGKFNGVVGEDIFDSLKINSIEIPTAWQIDSMNAAPVSVVKKKSKPKARPVVKKEPVCPWEWVHVGGDPFGGRDYKIGMRRAGVEWGVIDQLDSLIKAGIYEKGMINNGDTLLWMLSGEQEVKGINGCGVKANWKDGRVSLPAQIYYVDAGNGWTRRFARPDICFNWCELPPIKTPEPEPEPEPIPEPQPIPEFEPELVVEVEEPPIIAPPAPSLPVDHGPFVRADLWLGDDRMCGNKEFEYGFRRRGADFYGGKGDLFWQINSHFALGATGLVDGWSGESRSGYMYSGFEAAGGPMSIISFNPHIHWGLECIAGGQWEWGWISKYEAFLTNGFVRPGSTLDLIFDFWHFSSWGGFKFSFAEVKESYWDGVQFGTGFMRDDIDTAETRVGADGGCRLYFWQGAKASPFIVYRGAWTKSDHARTNAIGGGVRVWNRQVAIETSFKNRSHSKWEDSNGNALEMVLTISLGHGRGRPAEITPLVEVPKFIPDQDSSESVNDSIGKEADEDEWNEW